MKVNKEELEREKRWEAEHDYDTLISYQKLVEDPKRLEAAKKLAKERQNEILKILKMNDKKED
jgi:hypothetical protein